MFAPLIFLCTCRKVLSKLSKEKGREILAEWIKRCDNHLYWSATTTFSGNGKVIWAKFKTFLSHIINTHSSLDNLLFNKCGQIHPRKWLHADMVHITMNASSTPHKISLALFQMQDLHLGHPYQWSMFFLGSSRLWSLHSDWGCRVLYHGLWTRMWDTRTQLCNFHLTKTAHVHPHPVACSVPPQLVTHQITVHGLVIAPRRIIVSWWNMGQVQMLRHIWILTRSLNNPLQFHYHWTFSWISHLHQHLNFQRSGSKHISKPIKSLYQRLFWTTPPKFFKLSGEFGVCSLHLTKNCLMRAVYVKGTRR